MSTVPSLPSESPAASDWRGPRVKGPTSSNGVSGAALRLPESLGSPFATLLDAVGIGGEVGSAKVAENERAGEDAASDEVEEAPEEREGESDEKVKKRAQDAASEMAGVLAVAGAQSSQQVIEPTPVEAGVASGDEVAASASTPTLPEVSPEVFASAEEVREPKGSENDTQISRERPDELPTVSQDSVTRDASAESDSSEDDGSSFLGNNGSSDPQSDVGGAPVETSLSETETVHPQVLASSSALSQFARAIPGEAGASGVSTSGAASRVSGQVMGVASASGIGSGGAGAIAGAQGGGQVSGAPHVDQLALHLLGIEGSGAAGAPEGGPEGSLGVLREAAIDRSHLLRALGRIEKTLKGLAGTKEAKTVSLRLDPPSLGSMTVEVTFRDGELHARLAPELPQVAAMLRERSHELHAALRKMGLSVDQVRVSIDTGTSGTGAGDGGARHGNARRDGGSREFAEQVAPVSGNGSGRGDQTNGIGGAWRDGRWIA